MDNNCQPKEGDHEDPNSMRVVKGGYVQSRPVSWIPVHKGGDQEKGMIGEGENDGPKNERKGTSVGNH